MAKNNKCKFPKHNTLAYRLLELTAISGELPASLIKRLPGNDSYKENVIWQLKKDGLIRTFYRDKLRGYRLSAKSKAFLLSDNPKRFSFYLTGNTHTNNPKSEISRRMRLHRLAESYVMMLNAGVSVFCDNKEIRPSFCSSREIKENTQETVKIKNSRMTGTLITDTDIYVVYNIGGSYPKWTYQSELRTKVYIRDRQRKHTENINGLILSDSLEQFTKVFQKADSSERSFFLLDNNYEHFYYLTNNRYGEVLIRLMCDSVKIQSLNSTLSQGYLPKDSGFPIVNDAVGENGEPVLFGYLLDIPRINRFITALNLHGRCGEIICFDFQSEAMRSVCGNNVKLQVIDFEKFERNFFFREEK